MKRKERRKAINRYGWKGLIKIEKDGWKTRLDKEGRKETNEKRRKAGRTQ